MRSKIKIIKRGHTGGVRGIIFDSFNDNLITYGEFDNKIIFWEISTGALKSQYWHPDFSESTSPKALEIRMNLDENYLIILFETLIKENIVIIEIPKKKLV
jgi:WD40 repeat protein